MESKTPLKRTLSLPQMVLYGLGTTIGAGIYALVGELAGVSGYLAPVAFLFAAMLAGMTALSFAELSSRYPRAAGAALYTQEGFHSKRLAKTVGLLVVTAGLVSAAALVNAFSGYLNQIIEMERETTVVLITLLLVGLAIYGIAESVFIAALVTLVEVGGLIWIILVGQDALLLLPEKLPELIPDMSLAHIGLIFSGVLLAFYAFIGFEDMVDVAEEVKNARRTLPMAIVLTLAITTLLYMIIMTTAVLSIPPAELATSQAPLAMLYSFHTGQPATVISIIGMFAIINGSLIQIIMASRVLYGLSSRSQLPVVFSYVNPFTQTPIVATLMAGLIVVTLAIIGSLSSLAEITSFIMLTVFSLVNFALWRIKQRDPTPENCVIFPKWMPLIAFIASSSFVVVTLVETLL